MCDKCKSDARKIQQIMMQIVDRHENDDNHDDETFGMN